MNSIPSLLEEVESMLSHGVTYPAELLSQFNVKKEFDRENYDYLVNGGQAGAYYHWLTLLARHAEGAGLIVELGNRYGVSTLALFHGLRPETRLITVDVVRDQRYVPEFILNNPRVNFIFGDCLDLTAYERAHLAIPMNIDILWTDTIHFYKQIHAEFSVYEPLLADEAIVAIDDIRVNDKGRFFEYAPFDKRDLTTKLHSSGFGVLHYIRPISERGRSKEEREALSLRRSVEMMCQRYWDLFEEHETLKNQVGQSLFLTLQQKLVAAWNNIAEWKHNRKK